MQKALGIFPFRRIDKPLPGPCGKVLFVLLFFLYACNPAGRGRGEAVNEISYFFSPEGIQELRARFSYDEVTGWYTHQHWKEQPLARNTLLASVNENGYYILSSNYYGEKRLDHTHVIVQIGTQRLGTDKIKPGEAEHIVQYVQNKIVETNRYTEYRDKALFENIANSGELEIRIRFQARTAHVEALLPDEDRKALIDCFQLSVLNRMRSGK